MKQLLNFLLVSFLLWISFAGWFPENIQENSTNNKTVVQNKDTNFNKQETNSEINTEINTEETDNNQSETIYEEDNLLENNTEDSKISDDIIKDNQDIEENNQKDEFTIWETTQKTQQISPKDTQAEKESLDNNYMYYLIIWLLAIILAYFMYRKKKNKLKS